MAAEQVDLTFQTREALKALDEISKRVGDIRKASSGISFSGAVGQLAQPFGSTGQAIAQFAAASPIEKLVQLAEVTVRTLLPGVLSKLDILGHRGGAISQVAPLLDRVARLGINVTDKQIDDLYGAALAGEKRAFDMRDRLTSRANIQTAREVGAPIPEGFTPMTPEQLMEFWMKQLGIRNR